MSVNPKAALRAALMDCVDQLHHDEIESLLNQARLLMLRRDVRPEGTPRLIWPDDRTVGWYNQAVTLSREVLSDRRGRVAWRAIAWGQDEPILDRRLHTPDDVDAALLEVTSGLGWLTTEGSRLAVSVCEAGHIYVSAAFRRVLIRCGTHDLDDAAKKHLASLVADLGAAAVL